MTREELEELLTDVMPAFELRKDRKGQLIIHTGLLEDEYGELIDMNNDEEVELPEDEDLVPLEDEDDDD